MTFSGWAEIAEVPGIVAEIVQIPSQPRLQFVCVFIIILLAAQPERLLAEILMSAF
jgi:hypothetical protein